MEPRGAYTIFDQGTVGVQQCTAGGRYTFAAIKRWLGLHARPCACNNTIPSVHLRIANSFPDLPEKDRVKALLRRATARDALQRPDDAERDLKEVLRLEPGNRQAREDLLALRRHKEEMGAATAAMVQAMRSAGGTPGAGVGPNADRARAAAALAAAGLLPPGFDPSMLPPGLDAAAMLPPGFDPSQLAYSGEEGAGY